MEANTHNEPPTHSSSSSSSSPLLNLPAELRDLIYIHALPDLHVESSISLNPLISVVAVRKAILHRRYVNCRESQRQKGLPNWLLTCKTMLHEGADVFAREYIFTSGEVRRRLPVKRVGEAKGDVLNRIVVQDMIRTVVLSTGVPGTIGRVLEHEAQDGEITTHALGNSGISAQQPEYVRFEPWCIDESMLQILHRVGTRIEELQMHWRFHFTCCELTSSAQLRDETLELWVGKVPRVMIRLGSNARGINARHREARMLVERAARRLVTGDGGGNKKDAHDEVKVEWRREDVSTTLLLPGHSGRMHRDVLIVERKKT
jgi:hypothetical protein